MTDYAAQAEQFRSRLEKTTGMPVRIFSESLNGKVMLVASPNGDSDTANKIIDEVLIPLRKEAGTTKEKVGFSDGVLAEGEAESLFPLKVGRKNDIVISIDDNDRTGAVAAFWTKLIQNEEKTKAAIQILSPNLRISSLELPKSALTGVTLSGDGASLDVQPQRHTGIDHAALAVSKSSTLG
jgi:hypothetical protein